VEVAAFCETHDLVICSDEIHCDLILDDIPHIPTATLSPEIASRTITLQAPSKTYNIPGLGCSFAIISDAALRTRFKRAGLGVLGEVNNFGYVACEAAYDHGENWRQELLKRLRANRDLLLAAVNNGQLSGVSAAPIEATYLAWLNVEKLGLEDPVAFFEKAGVGLSGGAAFGDKRYVRLNYGCTEATLREGIERMSRALKNKS
jgi:cystathionine beta-lyase